MATPLKALLFLGGASTAAVGTAYVAGVFDAAQPPAAIMQTVTPPADAASPETKPEAKPEDAASKPAEQDVAAAEPEKPVVTPEQPAPVAPSFDLLRVEPDGSMVIAGKAMAGSTVEALAGSRVLGKTETTAEGDFVIVLDQPLKPGDYQVVLRSTGPGSIALSSVETAVVSVPATPDGQVLALVEQPGAPSKLITVTPTPEPAQPAASVDEAATPPAAEPAQPAAAAPVVTVEAVEIDGRKVFVAGAAPAGATLRAYANEILLGDTKATPDGRFLFETERDLPVGDYIVRVDQLSPTGDKVLARAAVPFKREQGESVAAVAPAKPSEAKTVEPAPSTGGQSAQTVEPAADSVTAPQLESSASGVIIRRGDTLWRISKRVYGLGTRYSTIYAANKTQIADPNRIWPGQVFRVPDTSEQGETADMDSVQDQATKL